MKRTTAIASLFLFSLVASSHADTTPDWNQACVDKTCNERCMKESHTSGKCEQDTSMKRTKNQKNCTCSSQSR